MTNQYFTQSQSLPTAWYLMVFVIAIYSLIFILSISHRFKMFRFLGGHRHIASIFRWPQRQSFAAQGKKQSFKQNSSQLSGNLFLHERSRWGFFSIRSSNRFFWSNFKMTYLKTHAKPRLSVLRNLHLDISPKTREYRHKRIN